MKKIIATILAVAMLLPALAACGSGGDDAEGGTIKIAVATALTGGSAEEGTLARNGVQIAIDEFNEAGGIDGKIVELVTHDDQADPKNSATVANAIVSDDDIIAVIGHVNSSCSLAAAAVYQDAGIPLLIPSSSSPKISDAGDYIFRVWNSDTYTAQVHMDIILDKGYTNIGVLYENNDYGLGALGVAQEVLAERGMEVSVAESYLLGETKDFTTILTKMKDAGVEAIFSISGETELPMQLQQAHSLDYYPFMTSTSTYQGTVISLGGEDVEGLYGATFFDPALPPERVQAYYDKYMETFNTDVVSSPACTAYIAATMVLDALKEGATTREDVKDYLSSGLTFDTMVGELKFDENGDTQIPLQHIVIQNGEFVGVDN